MAGPIPGGSGGTIAYITGLYDEIIDRVSRFRRHPDGWLRNLYFLLPIAAVVGLVLMARLIGYLFRHHSGVTHAVIGGLVIGSVIVIWPWKTDWTGQLVGIGVGLVCALVPVWIQNAHLRRQRS